MVAEKGPRTKLSIASSPESCCWSLAPNKTNMKMALSPVLFFFPLPTRLCKNHFGMLAFSLISLWSL